MLIFQALYIYLEWNWFVPSVSEVTLKPYWNPIINQRRPQNSFIVEWELFSGMVSHWYGAKGLDSICEKWLSNFDCLGIGTRDLQPRSMVSHKATSGNRLPLTGKNRIYYVKFSSSSSIKNYCHLEHSCFLTWFDQSLETLLAPRLVHIMASVILSSLLLSIRLVNGRHRSLLFGSDY